jgi:hypothetical protein
MGSRPLSSITRRASREGGQVLVLFAGGLIGLIAIAALVFDTGQSLLDRRAEQNVADAAALAGARYLPGACTTAPSVATCSQAIAAATAVAQVNGYVDGTAGHTVVVKSPPGPEAEFAGVPGHIEVQISGSRPSFFSGVLGLTAWKTSAIGVARNANDVTLPYSLLALDPSSCDVNKIAGNGGTVSLGGTLHVDSNCSPGALLISGSGGLAAPECDFVGSKDVNGGAVDGCVAETSGAQVSGDPLKGLPAPTKPALASIPTRISGTKTAPAPCPNSGKPGAATETAPALCNFTSSYAGEVWRVYPGYYPGGLRFTGGTVYMDPGVYWIGGGGFQVRGGVVKSTAIGDNTGTLGGGVLIYNSQDQDATLMAACASNPAANAGCYDSIQLNGSGAGLSLMPIQSGPYKNMVIFVDRTLTEYPGAADINLDGSSSTINISGTIYAPKGYVVINGGSSFALSTQIICWDFKINGNGGTLSIPYNTDGLFKLSGVGLVQ